MFLPTTREELNRLGWDQLDIILVTGDSYIDSPYIGVAVIGKVLSRAGYRVGVIAQPDIRSDMDIRRLGEPGLFWGVSGGSVDSMIANYTSLKRRRKTDDYTPGGINRCRPDRAVIVYTNMIRRYFKNTRPIVLGGIEASLRRIAHYDFWSDRVRSSILFDAKADYLLYGMAEKSVIQLAAALKEGADVRDIRGLCYIASECDARQKGAEYLELPPFETVKKDNQALIDMFHTFYRNNDPLTAVGLCQKHGTRYLVHNPPGMPLTQEELDAVYALDFERAQHPYYERQGKVKALETIKFSISTHRGCYGECNFCAITVHEGRTVQWRSQESILAEARQITNLPDFKGYIVDVGGPTANMYGFECEIKLRQGICQDRRCLYPQVCPSIKAKHRPQVELLRNIRSIKGVKKVFVASGIRYDLLLSDRKYCDRYLQEVVEHHVSGQMKVAPEHTEDGVLNRMGKTGTVQLLQFKELFDRMTQSAGKEQFLTYYFIAAHPGCTDDDMKKLKQFTSEKLKINPEQVQIFCPAPSTYSSLMYYTEVDPFTGKPIFVEKDPQNKDRQKSIVVRKRLIPPFSDRTLQRSRP
ncbi:MAG: YgiQ family radical SAM protein [Dehalococcoidia bacterium]|nr:YgiQ family radical SAM protein [Dehalococcoidia bacterium]